MSLQTGSGADFNLFFRVASPNTGGWQTWQDISETVNLPAGTHALYLYAVQGGFNLNYITFQ